MPSAEESTKVLNDARTLTHSGEAYGDGRHFADMLKHLGLAVAADVVRHLKVAKRSCEQRKPPFIHAQVVNIKSENDQRHTSNGRIQTSRGATFA